MYRFLLFVVMFICILSCSSEEGPGGRGQGPVDGQAAEFQLPSIEGEEVALSDFDGQIVLLNFWATWCAPCRIEIPHLIELSDRYRSQGLAVIGVALDPLGVEDLKELADEMKINYPVLIGDEKVSADYGGVVGIPTTFVIGRNGVIRHRHVGLVPETLLEKHILALLNE